jgi:glutamyl-tRNA synthetase
MPLDELVPLVSEQLKRAGFWRAEYDNDRRDWLAATVDLLRARYRTTADFTELGRPYFSDDFEYEPVAVKKNLKDESLKYLLAGLAERMATVESFTHDNVEGALRAYSEEQGVKAGLLINASRTALTGQGVGPGMFDIMVALGRDRTVERLQRAVGVVDSRQ